LHELNGDWLETYTAVVSDSLDAIGLMGQAFSPRIRPLDDTLVMCGRARTAFYMEVAHVANPDDPYGLEIDFIDSLRPGDVAIMACGGSKRIAPWGGLLSTASTARGAAGCVTDGFIRDTKHIRELRLPVFNAGIAPLDSKGRGKLVAMDVPVICDGVRIEPGDVVVGDADGVVVVPQRVEDQVLAMALDKVRNETSSVDDLKAGAYLRDVFNKYKVL
jgi:regulator of RNase E activity RraA